jgi:hypothetical protein
MLSPKLLTEEMETPPHSKEEKTSNPVLDFVIIAAEAALCNAFSMMAVDFRALFNGIASVNAHYFEWGLKLMPIRARFSKRAVAPDSGTPSLDRHFERSRF